MQITYNSRLIHLGFSVILLAISGCATCASEPPRPPGFAGAGAVLATGGAVLLALGLGLAGATRPAWPRGAIARLTPVFTITIATLAARGGARSRPVGASGEAAGPARTRLHVGVVLQLAGITGTGGAKVQILKQHLPLQPVASVG